MESKVVCFEEIINYVMHRMVQCLKFSREEIIPKSVCATWEHGRTFKKVQHPVYSIPGFYKKKTMPFNKFVY